MHKTMTLEFELNEQDFLDFQLFAASQSKRIAKNKFISYLLAILIVGAFAVLCYLKNSIAMFYGFSFTMIVLAIFYPKYTAWRYKRHYKSYIKENFSYRFGEKVHIEIGNQTIFCKDKTGEGTINISEIEKIDETENHFFVKIKSGISLIIPKQSTQISDEIRTTFETLNFVINRVKISNH